ncbi:hypothetical protein D1872_289050 [compost metagenome]
MSLSARNIQVTGGDLDVAVQGPIAVQEPSAEAEGAVSGAIQTRLSDWSGSERTNHSYAA